MIGVHPDPFTLRALFSMSEARQRAWWDIGSSILCMIANVNRSSDTEAFSPREFHPFERKLSDIMPDEMFAEVDSKVGFAMLKKLVTEDMP